MSNLATRPRGAEQTRSYRPAPYPSHQTHPQKRQFVAFAGISTALTHRKPATKPPRGRPIQPAAPEPSLALFQALGSPWLLPLPWHLAYPLNFLTGGKTGQAGVSDHSSFRCLRLRLPQIRSRTTKTKSTINPMAATTNRPPPKQNGSKYTSRIFATYQSPIP